MHLIALIMGVAKPVTHCAARMLSSTSIATASISGITSRMRLRSHHRNVWWKLRLHGLSGSEGMTKSLSKSLIKVWNNYSSKYLFSDVLKIWPEVKQKNDHKVSN